jgi:hypothetical protein
MKRRSFLKAAGAMALVAAIVLSFHQGSMASPTISPLPCPTEITPPGAICVIEPTATGNPANDQKRVMWRIAFPFVAR